MFNKLWSSIRTFKKRKEARLEGERKVKRRLKVLTGKIQMIKLANVYHITKIQRKALKIIISALDFFLELFNKLFPTEKYK